MSRPKKIRYHPETGAEITYKEWFKIYKRKWYLARSEEIRNKDFERKLMCFKHYSETESPFCACCGEHEIVFLSMDHIDGSGRDTRKNYKGSLYRFLENNNYPEGFQVLCMNCNFAKGIHTECPHQIARRNGGVMPRNRFAPNKEGTLNAYD